VLRSFHKNEFMELTKRNREQMDKMKQYFRENRPLRII